MSTLKPITVNVETYLGLNKYEVDEGNPHIKVASNASPAEFGKLVRVCPAALYKVDGHGGQTFDFAGCLECGTCRIACGDTIIELWRYPGPTMGVEYRYG